VATASELMAAIGFGKYSSRQVLNKLSPGVTAQVGLETEPVRDPTSGAAMSEAVKRVHMHGSDSLQVEGQDDLLVYRARCCNPIRGEEIVGYVTRGKGVAVHARSCPNVQNLLYESDRRISVEWGKLAEENAGRKMTYPVRITVFCDDRAGMLKEMTAIISDDGTNIRGVDSKPTGGSEAMVEFVLEAEDMRHLTRIVTGLRRVPGVRDVQRAHKV
jgi:GTP pyrophosphokinase